MGFGNRGHRRGTSAGEGHDLNGSQRLVVPGQRPRTPRSHSKDPRERHGTGYQLAGGANGRLASWSGMKRGDAGGNETVEEFTERVRHEFENLQPDEGILYDALKRDKRVALEQVAKELGLWWGVPPWGQGLVIFREGNEAAAIRRRLEELEPGNSTVFEGMEPVLRLFAGGIADSMGLTAGPHDADDDRLEVFNLRGDLEDFSKGMRTRLLRLDPGEVLSLPANLSGEQQIMVKSLAKENGYLYDMFSSPGGQYLMIGNLQDFQKRIRKELRDLDDGESITYGPTNGARKGENPLSELERQLIQSEAKVLHLPCAQSTMEDGNAQVKVERPEAQAEEPDAGRVSVYDEDKLKRQLAELFTLYASGYTGSSKIMRRLDVLKFMEDSCQVRFGSRETLEHHLVIAEETFDDTLEMQVDMGLGTRAGLGLKFFQVFMTKTANAMGASLIGLLSGLLEHFKR